MAFRAVEQLIPFFDNDGAILADGTLTFSLTGTATAASVFTNPGLSVACANPLGLDSAGRPDTDCWAGVPLRIVVKNAAGTVIRTMDNCQAPSSDDTTLPAFEADKFLTNDGAVASWETIRQVPDPSGSDGRVLTVVAGAAAWVAADDDFNEDNLPGGFTEGANSFRWGNKLLQWGSDTAPTAGGYSTTKAVTWGTAYSTTPTAWCIPTIGPVNSEGACVSHHRTAISTTGATFGFYAGAEDLGTGSNTIDSAVTFDWYVLGTVA